MGKELGALGMMGVSAIEPAVNAGLGLLLQKHNDRRQLEQQDKLLNQQYGYNRKQMTYQKGLDLQMWKDTNYPAQIEMLKQAGLNPGLIYGMSGGGGTTTGGGGTGVNAASAPQGGGEIMGLQLLGAQKALIDAQTEKTKAETVKTTGADTDLTKAQTRIATIQGQMMADTYEETFSKIRSEAATAEEEFKLMRAKAGLAEGTIDVDIQKATAELVGIGIANELRRVQTDLTQEQIDATIQSVAQKWKEIEIQKGRLDLDKFVKDIADSTRLQAEVIMRTVGTLTGGLLNIAK